MSEVGETLRRERVRQNLTIEQIARVTRIQARLLEAIENEQFELLPGGVFAKAFVRQYARFLHLNEDELAAEAQRLIQPQGDIPGFASASREPVFKVPKVPQWESGWSRPSSSALPSLAMLIVVMLICSAVYVWWQRSRRPAPATPPVAIARTTPAPKLPEAAPTSVPPAPQTDAAVAPSGSPDASLHAVLSAHGASVWVTAWSDGKQVIAATLAPNETRKVDASQLIRIHTGNAGSLEVSSNGKSIGPIGPEGQVRTVEITPQGVQILLPPPKPAPAAPAPVPGPE